MGVLAPAGEVIVALPAAIEPLRAVRSTLLLSSLSTLTENGHREAYFRALPPQHHQAMSTGIAGAWCSVQLAIAHYEACKALGLSHEAVVRLGRSVSSKLSGTLLGTAVRISKEMGVCPLDIIPQFQRFLGRAFQGGACCAFRLGPKEVRLEGHKAVLFDFAYFRSSTCGLLMGVLEPLCTRVYVTERAGLRAPGSAHFKIQWV